MSLSEKTIQITIKPNGSTIIQTTGFVGPACRRASRSLERALGEATAEQLTSEFYLTQDSRQENKIQN